MFGSWFDQSVPKRWNVIKDGGILNNFPSNLIREKCEKLIGVYVSPLQDIEGKQLNSIKAVSTRAYELLSHSVKTINSKRLRLVYLSQRMS